MNGIFNTVSNFMSSHVSTGNSFMANGDTAILAVGSFKCSEGTCVKVNKWDGGASKEEQF
jgi:hypothetical protein